MTNIDWIDAGGIALRYELSGEGPETLVLMHEMGGTLESWDFLRALLAPHFRILRYDARGAGISEHPPADFTIDMLAGDALALLDALSITTAVVPVGCAVGGAVALHFAATYPERTRAVVATSPATGIPAERRATALERADTAEAAGFRTTNPASMDRGYPAPLRGDTDRFTRTRAQRLAANRAGFAATMRMLAGLDMTDSLARIACPALVIAGEHDGDRPPAGVAATAACIPGARFVTLPSGHFMAIQTPELVAAEIMKFLGAT